MRLLYSMLFSVFTLLLVTACGGNSSDLSISGSAGLGTTVTKGVSITTVTAPNVAAAVLYGVSGVTGSSDGAASAPPLITGVAVNTAPGTFSLSGLLLDQLARIPAVQASTGNIVGAAVSNNVPCANSGVAALDVNLANLGVLTVGDTLGVSFVLCDEIGILLDGRLDMAVTDIQGSTTFDGMPPFNITLDVLFTALRALDGNEYYYADGDLQQVLVDDGAGNINSVVSGTSLDTSYSNQYPLSTAFHDQRLTAYQFDISSNENTGDYAVDLDGTVESRDIDGTVTFTTTDAGLGGVTFTGNEFVGNGDPMAGTVVITSSEPVRPLPNPSGSRMKLIALPNGVDVELQVDADLDGVYEDTGLMTTWAALAQL